MQSCPQLPSECRESLCLRLPGPAEVSLLIDQAGKGAIFGSCVCFQLNSYALTATCIEDSILLKIQAAALKKVMEEDAIIGYALQAMISRVYFQRYIDTMRKLQAVIGDIPLVAQ